MVEITEQEVVDIDRVNASGKLPVMLAIVGHSFGGLLTQANLCRRVGRDRCRPAPQRPVVAHLGTAIGRSVLGNPANRDRSVRRTYEQFHCAFANVVSERSQTALRDLLRPGLDQRSSRGGQVTSEFDDNVVRDAGANVLQWASTAEGAFPNGPPLFKRSYYVCPNGHWSIADSDEKILLCDSCTQIAERDYEIIEQRSRASRAEVGRCDPGMEMPRVGGT